MTDQPKGLVRLPHDRPLLTLLLCIVAVELVGASGGIFTVSGLEEWYQTLERPAQAPPDWVFAPVWTLLFAVMGLALWLVWRQAMAVPGKTKVAVIVFGIHFVANLGWSAVFFGLKELGWGLVVIVLLWILIVTTIWAFARVDRRAAALLVPYLLWVSFATYLNYGFYTLN